MNYITISKTSAKATSKIYRANFDRYSAEHGDVFLRFTDVRDEEGHLIKKSFVVSATKAMNLIGNLLPGQEVEFVAKAVAAQEGGGEESEVDFANIYFCAREHGA